MWRGGHFGNGTHCKHPAHEQKDGICWGCNCTNGTSPCDVRARDRPPNLPHIRTPTRLHDNLHLHLARASMATYLVPPALRMPSPGATRHRPTPSTNYHGIHPHDRACSC